MSDDALDLAMDRAHSARMYDFYLGGITNFPADREAAAKALAAFPSAPIAARLNRRFMHRSTRYLAAELGIRQFLDIGTGIPTSPNLHEIAQEVVPSARVVYIDNDPIVLAHARALLRSHPDGTTTYVEADARDPQRILDHPTLRTTLDFAEPIGVSLIALLHFLPDEEAAHTVVDEVKKALPSGSTLAISHATPDFAPEAIAQVTRAYAAVGTHVRPRTRDEVHRLFTGWDLLSPGLVPTHRWHPDPDDPMLTITDADASCYAAVARKP
ncbi:SAM-dependent methyltransferase [Streptomyces sp. NPDC059256]|uniref:SAM-dependent methyltransferase n=1 Tax=Streptomyces sp. NPDC059256 TaxID=3346794 RepID=UPI00368A4C12